MKKIMNKKLICLLLSFIMLMGVCLTGCSKTTDAEAEENMSEAASASAMTLTMYLMSEKPVSAETAAKIEAAVNDITETKYKTRMKLYYYTEEEYYAKLDAAFAARDEAAANGTLLVPEVSEGAAEEDTYVTEDGIVEIKYPTVAGYQVDIFYLGGADKFSSFMDRKLLSRLDGELNGASKSLTQYIPSKYFSALDALNNGTYAIPTNKAIGEYTYLLLNKNALKDAYRKGDEFGSLTDAKCQDFLKFINDSTALREKYVPLWTDLTTEDILATNLQFWGLDDEGKLSDAFSVLGGYYDESDKYLDTDAYAEISNLFENKGFVANLTALKEYQVNGYYGTQAELESDKPFAVGYVKGGADLVEVYGDEYEMVVVESPRIDAEDLYEDMFAVSAYTSNLARSMTILTHLNTDAEFRNLILYGIKGEHYQVIDTGIKKNEYGETYKVAKRIKEDYIMDLNKTGNTMLPYTIDDDSVLPYVNEYHVAQNRDADIKLSLGFDLDFDKSFAVDTESLAQVKALSQTIFGEYLACATMEEYQAFLTKAKADIKALEAVQNHVDFDHGVEESKDNSGDEEEPAEKACDKTCGSLNCLYEAWLLDMGIKK